MKHQMKRIFAGLLSAAILLPTTVSFTEPLSCSASELLGETSFDYKIIPWMPVESSPAKQDFDISDGAAHMTILNPKGQSLSVWDLKFRYRGLDFIEGHTYNVSCKIKARRAGMQVSSFIGTSDGYERYFVLDGDTGDMHMGPDMDGKWGCCVELSDEYQEFSGVFKPKRDIEGAVWEFWYAYDTNGYGGNAQEGDEIWFDDMSIIDMGRTDPMPVQSCGYTARQYSGLDQNYISVNQLGYFPGLAKYATLGNNKGDFTNDAERITLSGSYDYEIVNDDTEEVVYTGKTGKAFADRDSGDTVCKIDFTDFDDYGKYYIRIKGKKWRSFPFTIGYSIYRQGGHELLNNALNYFYQSRAGADIEEKYITSGNAQALAHAKNRDDSLGVVQEVWHNTPMLQADDADIHGSSRIDVGGGWYTGSGFDKNMPEAGCALWTLQNLYERCDLFMDGEQLFEQNPETEGIPETGNRCPDILDECRYELDFMSKMKVQPDEPTWGEYAGLYYHRAQGVGFVPNPPDYELEYQAKYAVYPPTFAATLSYAACAAQGARLWLQYDSDYAAALLKSAKEAYQAYLTHYYEADFGGTVHPDGYISFNEETNEKSLYAPRFQGRSKLTDSDMYVKDDAYWAACEIYLSSYIFDGFDEENDQKADMAFYLKELSSYSNAFQVTARVNCYTTNAAGESTYSMFSSSNMASAGSLSLEIFSFRLTEPQEEKLQKSAGRNESS